LLGLSKRYQSTPKISWPLGEFVALQSAHASISAGDYGWEAENIHGDNLIYLQGLNDDWNVVWYAGFCRQQLEYVCEKPENQYQRRTWQRYHGKCPFTVLSDIPNVETFGLPLLMVGRWVQGVHIPLKPKSKVGKG
jgi:hypothetical protein